MSLIESKHLITSIYILKSDYVIRIICNQHCIWTTFKMHRCSTGW